MSGQAMQNPLGQYTYSYSQQQYTPQPPVESPLPPPPQQGYAPVIVETGYAGASGQGEGGYPEKIVIRSQTVHRDIGEGITAGNNGPQGGWGTSLYQGQHQQQQSYQGSNESNNGVLEYSLQSASHGQPSVNSGNYGAGGSGYAQGITNNPISYSGSSSVASNAYIQEGNICYPSTQATIHSNNNNSISISPQEYHLFGQPVQSKIPSVNPTPQISQNTHTNQYVQTPTQLPAHTQHYHRYQPAGFTPSQQSSRPTTHPPSQNPPLHHPSHTSSHYAPQQRTIHSNHSTPSTQTDPPTPLALQSAFSNPYKKPHVSLNTIKQHDPSTHHPQSQHSLLKLRLQGSQNSQEPKPQVYPQPQNNTQSEDSKQPQPQLQAQNQILPQPQNQRPPEYSTPSPLSQGDLTSGVTLPASTPSDLIRLFTRFLKLHILLRNSHNKDSHIEDIDEFLFSIKVRYSQDSQYAKIKDKIEANMSEGLESLDIPMVEDYSKVTVITKERCPGLLKDLESIKVRPEHQARLKECINVISENDRQYNIPL